MFFSIVINDPQTDYRYYYKTFFTFLVSHFVITFIGRGITAQHLEKTTRSKEKSNFNTLLVGGNTVAAQTLSRDFDADSDHRLSLCRICRSMRQQECCSLNNLPLLGGLDRIEKTIDDYHIDLVVIAMEKSDKEEVEKMIERLSEKDVEIKIIPDILDILRAQLRPAMCSGPYCQIFKPALSPNGSKTSNG